MAPLNVGEPFLLRLHRSESMTNSELAAALGWGTNRVAPRVNELREAGKVVYCNPRCPNPRH